MENEIKYEQNKLDAVLSIIDDQIKKKRQGIPKVTRNDVEQQIVITEIKTMNKLEQAKKDPYFGRLDFKDNYGEETIYIGKRGIDNDGDIIVVDWRTDFGKLYNTYHGKQDTFYIGENQSNKVTIKRKRAITIKDHKVINFKDIGPSEIVETESGQKVKYMDDFLAEILRHTGDDHQLREIIASIQEEQDHIIRLPMDHSIIVQGAAGSGKSTIALHRISYLLYEYQDKMKPKDVLVLAPNEMFLSYIQNLVPELDIEGIEQRTFYDWASHYFTDVRDIPNLYEDYVDVYAGENPAERITVSKYKGSLRFKKVLDELVAEVGRTLLPHSDIHLDGHYTLSKEEIDRFYDSRLHLPLNVRLQEVKNYILRWSQDQLSAYEKKVEDEFEDAYQKWVIPLPEGEERKNVYTALEKAKNLRIKQFTNKVRQEIEEYVKKLNEIPALRMYKSVFQKRVFNLFDPEMDEKLLSLLLKNGRKIRENRFSYEDIAPLIYLDAKMNGKKLEYEHIVIDEAQDYSPFQLAILKDYAKSMTILGDIAQGIFSFYGLEQWEEIESYFKGEHEIRRLDLQTSYRSTKEIMDLANRVLINSSYNFPLVIPVNRSGKEPGLHKVETIDELYDKIEDAIHRFKQEGYSTIAIITHNQASAEAMYDQLSQRGITEIELVSDETRKLNKHTIVIPAYLVKGLEFDAVVIEDVSDKTYQDNTLHAKLLYMSITRAHHELELFYRGNLTPLLEERDSEKPPKPRASFIDWLITDIHDPDIVPQVKKERIIEDTETFKLFEDEEEQMMIEFFGDDRDRVADFRAWLTVWKKWAKRKKGEK